MDFMYVSVFVFKIDFFYLNLSKFTIWTFDFSRGSPLVGSCDRWPSLCSISSILVIFLMPEHHFLHIFLPSVWYRLFELLRACCIIFIIHHIFHEAVVEGHLHFSLLDISLKVCHIGGCIHECDVIFEIYDESGLWYLVDTDVKVI